MKSIAIIDLISWFVCVCHLSTMAMIIFSAMHTRARTHVHAHTRICTHTHAHTCAHTQTHANTHTHPSRMAGPVRCPRQNPQVALHNPTDGQVIGMPFQACDVKRPLASVKRICEKGSVVQFGPGLTTTPF